MPTSLVSYGSNLEPVLSKQTDADCSVLVMDCGTEIGQLVTVVWKSILVLLRFPEMVPCP
jgi:hypothetical protein